MTLDAAQLATLKTHLDTTYSGQDNVAARDAINDPSGAQSGSIECLTARSVDLQAAVSVTEFIALSDAAQRAWLAIVGLGDEVPVKNASLRAQVLAIWGAGTDTRTALGALQTKTGSHAEVLWGQDARVSLDDIRSARKL